MRHGEHEDSTDEAEAPEREASEERDPLPLPEGWPNREYHAEEVQEPQGWQPIETCPCTKDVVYLVWDTDFVPYPVAAFFYREPIYKKVQRQRLVIGEWRCVEDELQNWVWSCGGLVPTHWLPWEPPKGKETCKTS